jgi:hypothetical protein
MAAVGPDDANLPRRSAFEKRPPHSQPMRAPGANVLLNDEQRMTFPDVSNVLAGSGREPKCCKSP